MKAHALVVLCVGFSCGVPETPPVDGVVDDESSVAVALQPPPRSLTLASWNVEWLGSTANGPADDALQLSNVETVLAGNAADVWGLSEVVTPDSFAAIAGALPAFDAVLATEVPQGHTYYTASEQKVGLLWRRDVFTRVDAQLIGVEDAFDFGSRPPLEVTLRRANGETLTVIVLHMKAFFDAASAQRRARAAVVLKRHLDTALAGKAFAVIGDWNDAAAFYADLGSAFRFVTAALPATTVTGSRAIDHHLVSAPLAAANTGAARLEPALPQYGTTTSDHYPVVSRYTLAPAARIASVLANEPGSDRSLEHVTLEGHADLGGWSLSDGTKVRHVFEAGTVLDGTLTVSGAEASTGTLSLNNGGDAVVLRDAAGHDVDLAQWASPQEDGVALTP